MPVARGLNLSNTTDHPKKGASNTEQMETSDFGFNGKKLPEGHLS